MTIGIGSQDVDEGFLARLTPLKLVVSAAEGISTAMATLLKLAAENRGGLTDRASGGLADMTSSGLNKTGGS